MEENKNAKESSDELLSLLSQYSAENRSAASEHGGNKAEHSANVDTEDDDVVIFDAGGRYEQPSEPELDVGSDSHYSDDVGVDGAVRETPPEGHFTDDAGNSLGNIPTAVEDTLSDEHFAGTDEAKAAYKRAKRRNAPAKKRGSVALSVAKALVYTLFVCCLSFFTVFGCFDIWPGIIPIANDVFAFSKGDKEIIVTVDEGMTTEQIADLLAEKGVIDEPKVFEFYVKYKYDKSVGLDKENLVSSTLHLGGEFCKTMFFGGKISPEYEREYLAGTHTLSTGMNYDQLLSALTTVAYVREEITVTIPEGYTVENIISLLLSNGIGTREGYVYAINEYPYKHEFVQLLNETSWKEGRTYRLEGYLYPDTYIFYKDATEVDVINKLLNSFSNRVWSEYYSTYKAACDELGFSFDEMITFASVVQAEGKNFSDFENISQVFHNRRNSTSSDFRKMESCATIQYVIDYNNAQNGIVADRKAVLDDEDLQLETPYNTYKYEGLPPGAVCNPGLDAIEAALYPDMSNETKAKFGINTAYYFNSDLAGNIYYAQTPYQHSLNKQKAATVNEQIANGTYTG